MTALTHQLPAEIERYLDRFVWRRRLQRLLRAGLGALLFTLVWGLICCVIDRLMALPGGVRWALLALNVAGVMVLLARPLTRLLRQTDWRRAAASIERREPALAEKLSTVTSRALGPAKWVGSQELLSALTEQVVQQVRASDPSRLLPWRPVLRPAVLCAAMALLVGTLTFWSWLDLPTLVRRYVTPMAPIRAVTSTRLLVGPGSVAIPSGDPLTVRVRIVRGERATPMLHVRVPGGAWHEQAMVGVREGERALVAGGSAPAARPAAAWEFEARVRELERNLEYFVSAGDARSETYFVEALPRPAVTQFRVHYSYPPYTGLPPREVQSASGAIEAPVGTEVLLTIETSEPLDHAVLTVGAESMLTSAGPEGRTARLMVRQDKGFSVRMVSARGAASVFRGGTIRAITDRVPIVWLRDKGERFVGSRDAIDLAYQTLDDYGLARLDAEVRVQRQSGAEANSVVPIALTGAREHRGTVPIELSGLGLKVGDRVEVRLRAEDRAGQFALSDAAVMQVVSETPAGDAPVEVRPPVQESAAPPAEAPPLDPPGYGAALRAYFEALRRGASAEP